MSLYALPFATAVAQTSPPPAAAVVTSQPARHGPLQFRTKPEFTRWWKSIGLGILLLVILLTSLCAILVFSRRFKEYLTKSESGDRTPSDDVWLMHKLGDWQESDHASDEDEGNDTPPGAG